MKVTCALLILALVVCHAHAGRPRPKQTVVVGHGHQHGHHGHQHGHHGHQHVRQHGHQHVQPQQKSNPTSCFRNLKANSIIVARGANDKMEAVDSSPDTKLPWLNKDLWSNSEKQYSVSCKSGSQSATHLCHLLKNSDCSGAVPEKTFTISGAGVDPKTKQPNRYVVRMHQVEPNEPFRFSVTDSRGEKVKVSIRNSRRRLLQDGDVAS